MIPSMASSTLLLFLQNIAKTGSLCCVAARPHESIATSREWPIGPHEPYWRTNTSFSPPPTRWDYRFQSEGIQPGSSDNIQLFGSTSSNSKESRSWIREGYHTTHQYSASEGGILFFSSPSDTSQIQPWTPPPIQGINVDEYETIKRDQMSGPLSFTTTMEGMSMVPDSGGSISSRSDGSEFDPMLKLHLSTAVNFPSRRSFMSKPIHPLSFPVQLPTQEASTSSAPGFPVYDAATPQRDSHRLSSGSSSIDLTDIPESYEPDLLGRALNSSELFKCGLCDRLLSQRSPWSSRRIIKTGDMPVTGVLSCRHVFHAECLEHMTPKSHKSDPPCPLCTKVDRENSPDKQHFIPRPRNNVPRLRAFSEEGSSKSWGCVQAGDCVEGALHTPHRSSMLLLNRNRIKKSMSLKGNSSNDFSGKSKKTGSYPLHLFGGKLNDHGIGGCSKGAAGSSMKN